jgi:hypothetical protein
MAFTIAERLSPFRRASASTALTTFSESMREYMFFFIFCPPKQK